MLVSSIGTRAANAFLHEAGNRIHTAGRISRWKINLPKSLELTLNLKSSGDASIQ